MASLVLSTVIDRAGGGAAFRVFVIVQTQASPGAIVTVVLVPFTTAGGFPPFWHEMELV